MNNLTTYQVNALRTEAPMSTAYDRLDHAGLGFITETGEIATQVKRIAIYGKSLDSLDGALTLRQHIAEEVGDVMWYLAIASDTCGLNIFHVLDVVPAGLSLKEVTKALANLNGKFLRLLAEAEHGHLDLYFGNTLREMWKSCQAIACLVGVPIDEIAGANIAKLQARFPGKFSTEAAEARADKGGLDARNS
jgi:NTP pyrophosphatase (non-canonical NTP hydrolase)